MSKSSSTVSSRIGRLAVAIAGLVIALWLVFDLLSRAWIWLVVTGCLVAAGVVAVRVIRARRDRW